MLRSDGPDVVVLRSGTHGMPAAEYATALRDRLPDAEVAHARTPAEERGLVAAAPVVTGTDISEGLLAAAEELALFAVVSTGYEHLPLETFGERGVALVNAAGVHAPGVADQVLASMLSFTRRLGEARRRQERDEWRHFQARELADSTVTVVGQGSIGRAVVERLSGWDLHTVGVRYTPSKGGPADEVIGYDREAFHDALARTDYLAVAAPLTDETRGLLGTAEFETLPEHAVLVNVGRGPIVDTDALLAALRGNAIGGAALDVTDPEPLPPEHPLWDLENCLITPHNAGHSPRLFERMADLVGGNVERVAETGSYEGLENQVL
jgi:phosphoglycerate dehydrogenase-like enzyme